MNWYEPIDIYCERLSAQFWAEPFNALTNIAFILAAIIGFIVAKKYNRLDFVNVLLILLAVAIGVGSFLFHTYANAWSEYADLIPIASLALIYIAFSVRRFFNKSWLGVTFIALLYFGASAVILYFIAPLAKDSFAWLNGSHIYAPVLLGLLVMSFSLLFAKHRAVNLMLLATITFIISLSFRTMDKAICESFPTGTHFIWHSLNGLMIAVLLVAIIKYGKKKQKT